MKEYMLFLRGGDDRMENLTEAERNVHMQKWGVYMNNLAEKGHLAGGMPLQMSGRLLTAYGVKEDTARTEAGESIGGWLHFKADNYDQAVKLAMGCPIFEHDGNIEIREVMPMEM